LQQPESGNPEEKLDSDSKLAPSKVEWGRNDSSCNASDCSSIITLIYDNSNASHSQTKTCSRLFKIPGHFLPTLEEFAKKRLSKIKSLGRWQLTKMKEIAILTLKAEILRIVLRRQEAGWYFFII